jgi:hypothetical protein
MLITVAFDSLDEFEAFRTSGKKTRTGKKGDGTDGDDTAGTGQIAPAPLAPPVGQAGGFPGPGATAFTPPGAGAAFPGPGATTIDPAVTALVARIQTRMDTAVASGATKAEDMLNWFRGQCGPEAAQATMDQIKTIFLYKQSIPALENIAKLMSA